MLLRLNIRKLRIIKRLLKINSVKLCKKDYLTLQIL